jgi:hypothetical protein
MATLQRAGGQRALQVEPQPAKPSLLSRMGQSLSSGVKSLKNYVASIEMPRMPRLRGAPPPQPERDLAHLAMKGHKTIAEGAALSAGQAVDLKAGIQQVGDRSRALMALRQDANLLLDLATHTRNGLPDGDLESGLAARARINAVQADPGDAEAAIRQAARTLSPAQLNQALIGMDRMSSSAPPQPGKMSLFMVANAALTEEQTLRALAPTTQNLQALLHYNIEGAGRSSLTQVSAMSDGHPAKALLLNHLAKEFSLENYNFSNAAERLGTMLPGPERTELLNQMVAGYELDPSAEAPVVNLASKNLKEIHHALKGQGGPAGAALREEIDVTKNALSSNTRAQAGLGQIGTLRTQLSALRAQHGDTAFAAVGADQKQVDSYKAQIAEINKMKALSPEDDSMDGMLSQLQGQLAICEPKQKLTAALKALKSEVGDATLDAALSPDFEATMRQALQALKQAHDVDLPANLALLQATLDGLPATKGRIEREDEVIGAINDFGKPELENLAQDSMGRFKYEFAKDLKGLAAQVGQSKSLAAQSVTAMAADPLALVELLRLQPAGSPMLMALQTDSSGVREMHNFIVKFDAAMGQSTPTDKNTALRNLYQTAVQQAEYSGASEGVGNPFEVNLTGDAKGAAALRNCDNAYDQGTDMTQAMKSVKDYLVTMTSSDLGLQSPVKQFAAALAASPLLT